jgi:hypothetical protein
MPREEDLELIITRAIAVRRPIIISLNEGIVAYAGPPSWRLIRFDPPLQGWDALRALIEVGAA